MNKNAGLLSSADSIIENKLTVLSESWPEDVVSTLRAKIGLYSSVLSMRRTLLLHENASQDDRKAQTDFLQSLRVVEKSHFDRDAASFPAAYRNTAVDLLAMYTGLRASEILRESHNQRLSLRVAHENEALIRHWEQTGLVLTETIVDGAPTTVPNALWENENAHLVTSGTEARNSDWSAEETFAQRLTIFSKTAELGGRDLRQYLSATLAPAHRAAEAEIARRHGIAKAENIDNDTFRTQNKSLIHHADALEKRVAYVFNRLSPPPAKSVEASAAPIAVKQEIIPPAPENKSLLGWLKNKATEAYELVESGTKLIAGGLKWLTRPVAAGAATASLTAAAAIVPAPLADAEITSAHPTNTVLHTHVKLTSFQSAAAGTEASVPHADAAPKGLKPVGTMDNRLEIR